MADEPQKVDLVVTPAIIAAFRKERPESSWSDREIVHLVRSAIRAALPPAYVAVAAERRAQDTQWGGPHHDDEHLPMDWFMFIEKQVDRAGREYAGVVVVNDPTPDPGWYRRRLVKIAALALAALESSDRWDAKHRADTAAARAQRLTLREHRDRRCRVSDPRAPEPEQMVIGDLTLDNDLDVVGLHMWAEGATERADKAESDLTALRAQRGGGRAGGAGVNGEARASPGQPGPGPRIHRTAAGRRGDDMSILDDMLAGKYSQSQECAQLGHAFVDDPDKNGVLHCARGCGATIQMDTDDLDDENDDDDEWDYPDGEAPGEQDEP